MLRIITTLMFIVAISACGTQAARVFEMNLAQSTNTAVVTLEPPASDCYVVSQLEEGIIAFSASTGCDLNTAIPFKIANDQLGNTVHDGGVYAGGTATDWHLRPGEFNIVSENDELIGRISVIE